MELICATRTHARTHTHTCTHTHMHTHAHMHTHTHYSALSLTAVAAGLPLLPRPLTGPSPLGSRATTRTPRSSPCRSRCQRSPPSCRSVSAHVDNTSTSGLFFLACAKRFRTAQHTTVLSAIFFLVAASSYVFAAILLSHCCTACFLSLFLSLSLSLSLSTSLSRPLSLPFCLCASDVW